MARTNLRTPAEMERQARETAAMLEATAKFSGTVNKIPAGSRTTKEPRERKTNRLVSYGPDAINVAEQNYSSEGSSRVATPRVQW
jgi:hypothetical protein